MALTPQEELELLELEEAEYQHQKRKTSGGIVPGDIAKKFAQGASLGFLPRVAGALEVGGQAVGIKGLGSPDLTNIEFQKPDLLEPSKLGEDYESAKKAYEQALDVASERSPISSGIAEFAGGMMSPGSPLKGAGLAEKALRGAASGTIAGYGYSRSDDEKLGRMGLGAALGAAAPVVLDKAITPAIAKTGKAVGKFKDMVKQWGDQFRTMPKADAEDIKVASQALGFEPSKAMLSESKQIASLEEGLTKGGGMPATPFVKQAQSIQEGLKKATDKVGKIATGQSYQEAGEAIATNLNKEFDALHAPVKEAYQMVEKPLQQIGVNPQVVNKAFGAARRNDFFRTDQGNEFLDKIQKEVSSLSSVASLNKYISDFWKIKTPMGSGRENDYINALYGTLKSIRDNSLNIVKAELPQSEHKVVDEIIDTLTQAEYQFSSNMRDLNSIRNVLGSAGKEFSSPAHFKETLGNKQFEQLGKTASNLSAETLSALKGKFPSVFEKAKEARVNEMIEKSLTKGDVDLGKLVRNYNRVTPEARKLMFDDETLAIMDQMSTVYNALPNPVNPSNTSGMQRMWESFSSPAKTVSDYIAAKALNEAGPKGSTFSRGAAKELQNIQRAMRPGGSIYGTPSSIGEKIPRVIQPKIKTEETKSPDQTSIMDKIKGSEYEQVLQNAMNNGGQKSFAAANYVLMNRDNKYRRLISGEET